MAHHHFIKIGDNVVCRDKIYGAYSVTIDYIKSSSSSSVAHPILVEIFWQYKSLVLLKQKNFVVEYIILETVYP